MTRLRRRKYSLKTDAHFLKWLFRYNASWTPSGFHAGVWHLNDSFNVQLNPWGRASFNLVPIVGDADIYLLDDAEEFGDAQSNASGDADHGVQIKTYPSKSPNQWASFRLDINNFRNESLDSNYTLFELLPRTPILGTR